MKKGSKQLYKMATLFSGAGGLDSGFVKTGNFKTLLANDVLDHSALTYTKNFNREEVKRSSALTYTKNYNYKVVDAKKFNKKTKLPVYLVGDVSTVDFKPLGNLDCMVGGPPCQDFSITRGGPDKRKGITVKRGKLYLHYVRALKETRPKVFAFENVPGLVSANNGECYKTILDDFTHLKQNGKNSLKYTLIFNKVVNAVNIGVPQSRRRLIVMGVKSDLLKWPDDAEIHQKAENVLTGTNSLVYKYPLTAIEAFEGKTLPELAGKYKKIMEEYEGAEKLVNTEESAKWKAKVWDNLTLDVLDDYIFSNGIKPNGDDEIKVAFDEHKKILKELGYYGKSLKRRRFSDESNNIPKEQSSVGARMAHIPPDMNHLFVAGTKWRVRGTMSNIYRRTHPLKPAYTVMAYGGGGTWSYHYEKSRSMLTNRERARLQTFPDSYMFEGKVSEVRAQIGEAVPVRLGQKLAEVAQMVLKKTKK